MDPLLGKGVKQAGHLGSRLGDCNAIYKCENKPIHYRHPGHSFQNLTGGINFKDFNWKSSL